MNFDSAVAIDWSGAKDPKRSIQVATCTNEVQGVNLANPLHNAKTWTRSGVYEWLQVQLHTQRLLVGIDFAFAYPYFDSGKEGYFPGHSESPWAPKEMWATIEGICHAAPDFYGGAFYRHRDAPFAAYLQYQTYTGNLYKPRLRVTERRCKEQGLSPSPVFKCVGPSSVGVGSISGMRFLHQIAQLDEVTIWPVAPSKGRGSLIVEIYPRVFLHKAGVLKPKLTIEEQVARAFACFQVPSTRLPSNHALTKDERDALVSAAGMFRLASDTQIWQPVDIGESILAQEGWIFGIT